VEDALGRRAYAIELKTIDSIKVGMFIGTKVYHSFLLPLAHHGPD